MLAQATVSACTVILIALGVLGKNPHHLARWSVELKIKKWYLAAALLKHSYSCVSSVCNILHSDVGSHYYERTAQIIWTEDLSFVVEYLIMKTGSSVSWEKNGAQFLEMFENIYGTSDCSEYVPKEKLGQAEIDWVKLGFQGKDPSTDFRGTGTLGVELLAAFCKSAGAPDIFTESRSSVGSSGIQNDAPWYPVALVSIRLTHFLTQKLLDSPERIALIWKRPRFAKESFADELADFHVNLLFTFHAEWTKSVAAKKITSFLDNEAFIRKFEEATNRLISTIAHPAS